MNTTDYIRQLEYMVKIQSEALISAQASGELVIRYEQNIPQGELAVPLDTLKDERDREFSRGYATGAFVEGHVIEAAMRVELITRMIFRAAWRMRGEELLMELNELAETLTSVAGSFKKVARKVRTEDAINEFTGQVSEIQDAIDDAIKGDGGSKLRELFPNDPLGTPFEKTNFKTMPERIWVGKRAFELHQYRIYKPWKAKAEAIFQELSSKDSKNELSPEEKAAYVWLKTWEYDIDRMADEVNRAYKDYKKLPILQV